MLFISAFRQVHKNINRKKKLLRKVSIYSTIKTKDKTHRTHRVTFLGIYTILVVITVAATFKKKTKRNFGNKKTTNRMKIHAACEFQPKLTAVPTNYTATNKIATHSNFAFVFFFIKTKTM